MELINGKTDFETNLKIEDHSERHTVYAIGSRFDIDEPMFLIIDDSMADGMAILKYVPDNDNEGVGEDVPISSERVKAYLRISSGN
ncbi:MAG: hypothetical protein WCP32_17450 [Bacteroidota bacterium]